MKEHQNAQRENVGKIDHCIFLYRDEAGQQAARNQFSVLFGICDWDELEEQEQGIHIFISWHSGIELIRPTKSIPAYDRHLEKHGDGFYGMVMGVEDLDRAMAEMGAQLGRPVQPLGPAPNGVFQKFEVVREAVVGKIGGTLVMIGEFQKKTVTLV